MRNTDEFPALVSATAAAAILGIHPPHLARLRRKNRLPDPIPVSGGYAVYLREEVEALAVELVREREQARKERERNPPKRRKSRKRVAAKA